MIRLISLLFLLLLGALVSAPALAYVGPGAGISVLGSLLGILATIVLAIAAIVMWPLRKMMKKKKAAAAENSAEASTADADSEQASDTASDKA